MKIILILFYSLTCVVLAFWILLFLMGIQKRGISPSLGYLWVRYWMVYCSNDYDNCVYVKLVEVGFGVIYFTNPAIFWWDFLVVVNHAMPTIYS